MNLIQTMIQIILHHTQEIQRKRKVTKTVNVKGIDAPPPTSGDIQKVEVFDTLSSINKADRKLYRLNNKTDKTAGFINRYGIFLLIYRHQSLVGRLWWDTYYSLV